MTRAERLERIVLGFFATSSNGSTAAAFRVAMGCLSLWQAGGIWLNLSRFYADDGLIPWVIVKGHKYVWLSLFALAPDSAAMLYGHAALFTAASVCLLAGFYPRVATLVVAYVHLSLQLRNPYILNSGDRLFMIIAALAAFMPLAHRFSVHSWLRGRRGLGPFAPATVWGQRLVSLQLAYVYLNACIAKLTNERWRSGMAMRDVLASPVFAEWPTYVDVRPLVWGMTYSSLAFELAFPAFVWFRRFRPWIIGWGIAFHVGIDALMTIPMFSYIMIVTYIAFLADSETEWLMAKLSRRQASPRPPSRGEGGLATEVRARSERPDPSPGS